MTARIIVAAHKPYIMPDSPLYFPVHVGSAGKEDIGFARDDQGENISSLNPWYCELTGIYWAWKNLLPQLAAETGGDLSRVTMGTAHYRRYFSLRGSSPSRIPAGEALKQVLSEEELSKLAKASPIILPRKRCYYIETLRSHFIHAHGSAELDLLRETIASRNDVDLAAFDRVMQRRSIHLYNMFIMRGDLFDAYCSWLFPLLEQTAQAIKESGREAAPRIYGFISERLLDVWLESCGHGYTETGCLMLEKVNWPKKIAAFVSRKLKGGR
ncbi:DUF4422 domain-containing protein [Desulfovibrio sp. OttesenSCG-928-C06]|nr:DUF4422 domain-containing protein [Desulfovibrio sp. OttesenSCG-928-C06]